MKAEKVILIHARGDYIARIKWLGEADYEVSGGSRAEATRYTAAEVRIALRCLGAGYSAEDATQLDDDRMLTDKFDPQ